MAEVLLSGTAGGKSSAKAGPTGLNWDPKKVAAHMLANTHNSLVEVLIKWNKAEATVKYQAALIDRLNKKLEAKA